MQVRHGRVSHTTLYDFSVSGISGKSQVLFALVFTTRYLDLFTTFISAYNTAMKVIFILATFATLYLIFFKFRATYDSNNDTFRAELLVIPVAGLSVLVNHEFTVLEVCFSYVNYIVSSRLVSCMHFYYFYHYYLRSCGRFLFIWSLWQ